MRHSGNDLPVAAVVYTLRSSQRHRQINPAGYDRSCRSYPPGDHAIGRQLLRVAGLSPSLFCRRQIGCQLSFGGFVTIAEDLLDLIPIQIHYMRNTTYVSGLPCQRAEIVPGYVLQGEFAAPGHKLT